MFIFFSKLFQYLKHLPHFLFEVFRDLYFYIKNKGWKNFEGWGLHLYVGKFGAGKTCSMVRKAYSLCRQYPQLTIVTNLKLNNFPKTTNVLPLNSPQDILNAPADTLVLIDEIGTIFNSRDFASSKESVPKILFQHLCQCRKRKMMILATTQRWNFLDKQLRDITATVNVSSVFFSHPFSRMATVLKYDAFEYDRSFNNPLIPCMPLGVEVYVQTNKIRELYDTEELINNMLNKEYISDKEIMENRGELTQSFDSLDRKQKRQLRHSVR